MSAATTPATTSDPWEMALIHRIIRRGFAQARGFVLAPGAAARAGAVAEYLGFHLDGLHAHHSSEDEVVWPALRERASLSDTLIDRMEQQHAAVDEAIRTTRNLLAAWTSAPTAAASESLAAALDTIAGRLDEHLAEEEHAIVPLIAAHVTQAEWDHLGKVAFSKFTPKQRLTALGELLAAADATEAARMLAGLPAPVRAVWRLVGRRKYQGFIASVRG